MAKDFKTEWIDSVINQYRLKDSKTEQEIDQIKSDLSTIFDKNKKNFKIHMVNTVNFKEYSIDPEYYWNNIQKNNILAENGIVMIKHSLKQSPSVIANRKKIDVRQVIKKEKQNAEKEGDYGTMEAKQTQELSTKQIINGYYGNFLFVRSPISVVDLGGLVTCLGRNMISIVSLTVELATKGFRHYLFQAHTKLISCVDSESEELKKKYPNLPEVTDKEVAENILGYYYKNYYGRSAIENIVRHLPDYTKRVLRVKNDIEYFLKLPIVKEVLDEMIDYISQGHLYINPKRPSYSDDIGLIVASLIETYNLDTDKEPDYDSYVSMKDLSIDKDVYKKFTEDVKLGRTDKVFDYCDSFISSIKDYSIIENLVAIGKRAKSIQLRLIELGNKLYQYSYDLLFGFYYFDGDFLDGVYLPTTVDILKNIERNSITGGDTDSCKMTVNHECLLIQEMYEDKLGKPGTNYDIEYCALPILVSWIYRGSIDRTISDYQDAKGIEPEAKKGVELEVEKVMEQELLTLVKKNYTHIDSVKDFWITGSRKMYTVGLAFSKGNFNPEMCATAEDYIHNVLHKEYSKMYEFSYIFNNIYERFNEVVNRMRTDDFICNKLTTVKVSKMEIPVTDYRWRALRLWNMFAEDENSRLTIPGSMGMLNLSLTNELLDKYREYMPKVYSNLYDETVLTLKIKLVQKLNKFKSEYKDDDYKIPSIKKYSEQYIKNVLDKISKIKSTTDETKISEVDYNNILKFKESATPDEEVVLNKVLGCKTVEIEIENDDIIENIKKIALPLSLQEAPDFVKFDNFGCISIAEAMAVFNLTAQSYTAIGLVTLNNNNDEYIPSNCIATF